MMQSEQCEHLQKEELYSLSTIYLQDFEFIRQVHPYAFQIIVAPFVQADRFHHESVVYCKIFIDFPNDYPLKTQRFHFEIQGLSRNFQQEYQQRGIKVCEAVIEAHEKEQDAQPIVFAVVEALRDYMYDQSLDLQEMYDDQHKNTSDNYLYIPPMPRFATNTPVTLETFLQWKKKFDQELYEIKKREKNFAQQEEIMKKISGRQYFDKKHNKDDKEEEALIEQDDEDIEDLNDEDYNHESDDDDDDDDEFQPLYEREQLE